MYQINQTFILEKIKVSSLGVIPKISGKNLTHFFKLKMVAFCKYHSAESEYI